MGDDAAGAAVSNQSLQITRNCLERAITHAQANDLVAERGDVAEGAMGGPSRSFTVEQARTVLVAAERTRMHVYVTLSLMVGLQTGRPVRFAGITWWSGWMTCSGGGRSPRSLRRRAGQG